MYVKLCECCGKKFVSKSKVKKYCSNKCYKIMAEKREEEKWQPCCTCQNVCGRCMWSKYFLPVPGWEAEPTIVKDGEGSFSSYKIHKCPQYIRG